MGRSSLPEQQEDDFLSRGGGHRVDPCDHLLDLLGRAEGQDTQSVLDSLGAPDLLDLGGLREKFENCRSAGSSSGIAKGDFNGDGFADLAIGVPGKNIPATELDTGAVIVIYGSATGLTAAGDTNIPASQFWAQNSADVPGASEEGDRFGSALAAGDFNGDGKSDLAVGAPGLQRSNGFPATLTVQHNAGGVWVLYGQPNNGLTLANNQLLAQEDSSDSIGTSGSSNAGDLFGASLAAGNFNGDSSGGRPISDLAIGVPKESDFGFLRSISHAGRVIVLYGVSGTGLAKRSGQSWSQDSDGIVSEPLAGEKFGFSLAAGDFNGDKKDDLAVGVPGQSLTETVIIASGTPNVTVSTRNAGAVHIIPGSSSGLTANGSQFWNQDLVFGSGHGESDDAFGRALAAGDFNADGKADLAIGVPREDVGSVDNAGEVNVIYGSSAGLSTTVRTPQIFRDSTPEAGAEFGRSLTAWNFGRNETHILPPDNFSVTVITADLAISVPFKDVNGQKDAGAVTVFYGSSDSNGLTTSSRQIWTEDSPNVPGSAEPGDNFGVALY